MTHLLQPLDVSFFLSLANAYQLALYQKFRLTKIASVKKSNFIIIYQKVKNQIAKNSTIWHAWQKSSLFPMDPEVVLDKIKKKEAKKAAKEISPLVTPPEVFYVSSNGAIVSAPVQTPANISDVNDILEKIKLGNHTKLELQKLSKDTSNAFAKNTTLEITSKALLEKDEEMKKQVQQSNKLLGKGLIMEQKILEEQKANAQFKKDEKEYWDIWKNVRGLFKESKLTKATSLMEEQRVNALSKQNGKTHWDIWKDMILLFKEPKLKATRGKAKALRQEIIPETESILEAENPEEPEPQSDRPEIISEPQSDSPEIIQKVENEVVVRTTRAGRVLKLSTRTRLWCITFYFQLFLVRYSAFTTKFPLFCPVKLTIDWFNHSS